MLDKKRGQLSYEIPPCGFFQSVNQVISDNYLSSLVLPQPRMLPKQIYLYDPNLESGSSFFE